jgi:hypothetical protein
LNEGNEGPLTQYYMYGYYSYPVTVKNETFAELIQPLPDIKAEELIENDAKDLAKYGLDKPTLRVVAKDKSNASMDISFGKDKDEDNIYFKTADSSAVYAITKGVTQPFINAKPFDLYDKLAYIVNINDVNRVEIKTASSTYNMEISREKKKAEKEGESDQTVEKFKVNNKDVEEDKFRDVYQAIIGLAVDSEKDKEVKENPEVAMTYYLNKGDEKIVKVTFTPYNGDFYAVHINGKSEFVISKAKLAKALGQFSF